MKIGKVSIESAKSRCSHFRYKNLYLSLGTRIKQFPDRSAKWLLENTENLRGLLEIIAGDIVEYLDFDNVEIKNTTFIADDLRQQESDLIYLLPFRDAGATSDSIPSSASENKESLQLSAEEESLMQSMAEYYLEQGKVEGKAEGLTEAYQQWEAWNARRMAAEAKGERFDEPPPRLSKNSDGVETRNS